MRRFNKRKSFHVCFKEASFRGQMKPEPHPGRCPLGVRFSDKHPWPFHKCAPSSGGNNSPNHGYSQEGRKCKVTIECLTLA